MRDAARRGQLTGDVRQANKVDNPDAVDDILLSARPSGLTEGSVIVSWDEDVSGFVYPQIHKFVKRLLEKAGNGWTPETVEVIVDSFNPKTKEMDISVIQDDIHADIMIKRNRSGDRDFYAIIPRRA